jgi:hypothetical protein
MGYSVSFSINVFMVKSTDVNQPFEMSAAGVIPLCGTGELYT